MSFTTPTNSILNRDVGDAARVSQVIYENESLKIQVETLQERLQSTGLLKLEDLRQENESLRSEVATLRVQLDEKTAQLEHYKSSGDRFSNIDQSLHELLTQIQTQRAEMTEMKDLTREKDARIAALTSQLQHMEEELTEAHAQTAAASADAAQQGTQTAETAALREQVEQLTSELETLRRASEEEVGGLQKDLSAAQAELLELKADAAAKSAVKGQRMTSQEQEIAECREREASSQRQVVALQAKMELLRTECSQLREAQADLVSKQQQQQQQQRQEQAYAAAQAEANQRVDLYCPEVKAHVEKAVKNAIDGVERRLREQVEQNASLLSRMALIQQESEAMMKSKGMSNHEVTVMKERVDMRSRRNDVRHTMQRRVAELLSNEELSKADIELLLQEMLDYQEDQDQENRTLLLVKDMESEERERVLRRELKRVKDENASLMKQLQQLAVEGFHRERSNSQSRASPGAAPSPREADQAPSAAFAAPPSAPPATSAAAAAATAQPPMHSYGAPAAASGASPFNASPTYTTAEPAHAMPEPSYPTLSERAAASGATLPQHHPTTLAAPAPAAAASPQATQPYQRQPPHPQFGGDLWSNPAPRPAAQHAQPQYSHPSGGHVDPQQPQHAPTPAYAQAMNTSMNADPNRNVMVHCPACTYTQKYGNRKCEICDAPLQLNSRAE